MKLKNKKTGEIVDCAVYCNGTFYHSVNDVFEVWEDYKEPKEYWYIYGNQVLKNEYDGIMEDRFKEIGNYFETREEAEKAVEKLKAWKRLKDKGFRFIGVRGIGKVIDFDMPKSYHCFAFDKHKVNEDVLEFYNDLMLVFGGEE